MSLATALKADCAAILNELGIPVTVRLDGVVVDTSGWTDDGIVRGVYIPEAETITGYEVEKVVIRPLLIFPQEVASRITRRHTLQPEGYSEMRIFGDPRPGAGGQVKIFLVP